MSCCKCSFGPSAQNARFSCRSPGNGGYRYIRHKNKMPTATWHVRAQRPTLFSYKTDGSYAGRNRGMCY